MNLAINLMLGGGAETPPNNLSPDTDFSADSSFSSKLAEELGEQQLPAPALPATVSNARTDAAVADGKTPVAEEAARQQIATVSADAAAGAAAEHANHKSSTGDVVLTANQTWWDIIEKARSFTTAGVGQPALQAEAPPAQLAGGDDENIAQAGVPAEISTAAEADTAVHAPLAAAALLAAPEPAKATSVDAAAGNGLQPAATPSADTKGTTAAIVNATAVLPDAAAAEGSTELDAAALARLKQVQATTTTNSMQTEHASVTAALPDKAAALAGQSERSNPADIKVADPQASHDNNSTLQGHTSAQTEATKLQGEPEAASHIAAHAGNKAAAADHDNNRVNNRQPADEQHLPADTDSTAHAVPLMNAARPAAEAQTTAAGKAVATNVSNDKGVASNSFAEHQKTVNQQLQQQKQQSGQQQQQSAQQQTSPLKTNTDAVQQAMPQLQGASSFSAQLQQLTELPAGPAASSPAALTAVSAQQHIQSATAPLAGKTTELPQLNSPLTLADPQAALHIRDRVLVQVQHKLQSAEVLLHPEELGAMQIKLNLQQDQLSVQFIVQPGAAKEALEQQMPKLRDMLEQQGIALAESDVEERAGQRQQERQSGQSAQHGEVAEETLNSRQVQLNLSDRMVDFYA